MGQVYKARDTRLDRPVALKVLLDHLAENRVGRDRFEREARAVAALNHPNICTLYDVGHQDGTDYLVMEFVEGETLAERLAKGPVPLSEALAIAIQIAEALDTAHRSGILHRDLKPGNIMLTKGGTGRQMSVQAKLLDFGLAKLLKPGGAVGLPDGAASTPMAPLTGEGMMLGTLQYMAPEQVEGREADVCTDIFALGLVIYEMLTGERAFAGQTPQTLIVSLLTVSPPPLARFAPSVSAALDHVVTTCLAKDPDERRQSVREVLTDLTWIAGLASTPAAVPVVSTAGSVAPAWRRYPAALAVAALVMLAAVVFGAFLPRGQEAAPFPAVQFHVLPPQGSRFIMAAGNTSVPSVSPDGRRLATVATQAGNSRIWVRSLDSTEGQVLAGTEGANVVYWSPDSRSLLFAVFGTLSTLKTVDASGGLVRTVISSPGSIAGGAAWDTNGSIVFSTIGGGLSRVAVDGGSPTPLTHVNRERGEVGHRSPTVLPDGRHLFYVAAPSGSLWLTPLDAFKPTLILPGPVSKAIYVPPGWLLFAQQGTLFAQAFDVETATLKGEATPLAQQLVPVDLTNVSAVEAAFGASSNGVLVYRTGASSVLTQLTWADRTGKRLGDAGPPGHYRNPALSPDGTRIAVEAPDPQSGTQDIWVVDLARGGVTTRFTFDPANDVYPIWSPDGRRILFGSDRDGRNRFGLYQKSADGVGTEALMVKSDTDMSPLSWSADERFVAYRTRAPSRFNIGVLSPKGDLAPYLFEAVTFVQGQGQISPDGRWLAYNSNESARYEVNVQSFPKPGGGRRQVSKDGGSFPRWRRDGKELYYYASDGRLMSVPIGGTTGLETGAAVALFQPGLVNGAANTIGYRAQYEVSPDGQRFLLNVPIDPSSESPITVVLNWLSLMRQ